MCPGGEPPAVICERAKGGPGESEGAQRNRNRVYKCPIQPVQSRGDCISPDDVRSRSLGKVVGDR